MALVSFETLWSLVVVLQVGVVSLQENNPPKVVALMKFLAALNTLALRVYGANCMSETSLVLQFSVIYYLVLSLLCCCYHLDAVYLLWDVKRVSLGGYPLLLLKIAARVSKGLALGLRLTANLLGGNLLRVLLSSLVGLYPAVGLLLWSLELLVCLLQGYIYGALV